MPRFVALLFLVTLTACPTDRGGGGTPMVCGTIPAGGSCSVSDDCVCGHRCLSNECLRVVEQTGSVSNPNVRQPTTQMRRICTQLQSLPCYTEPDCANELAESYADAEDEMCTPQFDAVLNCVDSNPFMCDTSGDPVSVNCMDELFTWLEACQGCQTVTGCSASPSPPPVMDAGTSTTAPPPDPCQVTHNETCSGDPTVRAAADCLPTTDGATRIWVCTCTQGAMNGRRFGVRSSDDSCCELGATIAVQCGLAP